MNQSMSIGKIGIVILFLLLPFISPQVTAQTTVSCNGSNPWVATQVYTSETVFYNGKLYQSQWYNLNQVPPTHVGNGQPWIEIGTCSQPITPASTSCENLSTWSASVVYNGGAEVKWNGYKYTASFYNIDVQPDVNGNTPWHLVAACGSPASLTIGGTLSPFTAFAASISAAQSFTITGSNLSNNVVTITAPANFEISLNQTTGYSSSLQLTPQSGSVSATIYLVYSPSGLGTDNGNIVISATGITTQDIAVTGTAQAIWLANGTYIYNANSGNVGIGTGNVSPSEKLTVNGNGSFTGTLRATGITLTTGSGIGKVLTSDATGVATWQSADFSNGWKLSGNSNIDATDHFMGTTNLKPVIFKTNNMERMRITPDGRIAIGDTYVPSGYKLSVNGKIIATEVAVFLRAQWPDYVFSPEHKLMTLGEVERYIKTHKHLPGMPAAEEVETKGMQVGQINTILVEKVEELTLHAIEHEKLIKEQKTIIDQLLQRIEKLETK